DAPGMGVAVEGSPDSWPGAKSDPALPTFDAFNQQRRYIDVFDKGGAPFEFTAAPSAPWISVSPSAGSSEGAVRIAGPGGAEVTVRLTASHPREITTATLRGFVEGGGYVSIE